MEREALRARVVDEALDWIGTPYRHQASRKGVGCDCLGLIRGIWRHLYGDEPEEAGQAYSRDWAEAGGEDRLLLAARRHMSRHEGMPEPGTVLLFRWRPQVAAKHLGVLLDAGRFIHAYEGHSVQISALVPQWRRRIAAMFDFPEPQDIRPTIN